MKKSVEMAKNIKISPLKSSEFPERAVAPQFAVRSSESGKTTVKKSESECHNSSEIKIRHFV